MFPITVSRITPPNFTILSGYRYRNHMNPEPSSTAQFSFTQVGTASLILSNTTKLSEFIGGITTLPIPVLVTLIASLESTYESGSMEERKNAATYLFVIFFTKKNNPEVASTWLQKAANLDVFLLQALARRILVATEQKLADAAILKQWLWNGAIRGSPIALEDLRMIDEEWYKQAKAALNGQYGGLGIDVLDGFEKMLRMYSYQV